MRRDLKNKRDHRRKNGQSLVEFALVLPFLLLLIFGFLDLGRAIYYYSAIGNAAREGARYASVRPMDLQTDTDDQDEVKAIVQNYSVALGLDTDKITFPLDGADPDSDPDEDKVTVKIEYDFSPITPFIGTLTLKAESTMSLAPVARQ